MVSTSLFLQRSKHSKVCFGFSANDKLFGDVHNTKYKDDASYTDDDSLGSDDDDDC